jgi:hypothetical protein
MGAHHRTRANRAPRAGRGAPGERGVTISEFVLVTVLLLGLVWVATTNIGSIRSETAASNCQSELRTLKIATESYRAANDAYPADKDVLIDDGLVAADDIEHWSVSFTAAADEPVYEPEGPCV